MECCGVDSYRDFDRSNKWTNYKNTSIPAACCKFEDKEHMVLADAQCPDHPTDSNSYQNRGCFDAIVAMISKHRMWIIITGCVVAVIELILIILSFCLSSSINKYRRMSMCA